VRRAAADGLAVLAVLAVDYALKSFAARAGARELRPLLAPTAALVSSFTGHAFEAEAGAGYVSRELSVVIAPVCSGVNFAIVAFTALTLGFVSRFATPRAKALWLVTCAPLAYAATIVTNALRIAVALAVRHEATARGLLSAQGEHRAVGVCVYLAGLLGLYALVGLVLDRGRPDGHLAATNRHFVLVPLTSYVAVTVITPLLHGRGHGAFWAHAAMVGGAASFALGVLWIRPRLVAWSEKTLGRGVARTLGAAGIRFGVDLPQRRGERPLSE
jgi:exosortase K